jgi:hypothetical protein
MTFFEYLSYFLTFVGKHKIMAQQERQVIHMQRGEEHFYFGSVAAMCEHFGKDKIGITYGSLRNYGLAPGKPYRNDKYGVVIRVGVLIAKEGNWGRKTMQGVGTE